LVIAVSAIDEKDQWAPFSCKGPEVELCAPGVNVNSTLPNNRYGNLNGTSMASPHVAGAAALAISSHRYAIGSGPPTVIRRLLAYTADNLGMPGRDNQFGFGVVDAEQAAFERNMPPVIPNIP
jgi:subtilisin